MTGFIETLPKGRSMLRISWGEAGRFFGENESNALATLANTVAQYLGKSHGIGTLSGQIEQGTDGNFQAVLAIFKP